MNFIKFTSDIADEWDRVVYNSDDGWVFSLSSWLQMVAKVWKMEDHSFAISENGKIVAVMPVHFVPAEARLSSTGWGHGGPVIVSGVSETDRRRLWKACFSRVHEIAAQAGATRITVSISPLNQASLNNRWGVNPLVEVGFEDASTHTRILNLLQTESELWFGLSQDARQKIKKARATGYSVKRVPWGEMLDEYYRIHVENYHRTGVNPHPKAYFEGFANQPSIQDHTVLWVGFDLHRKPVAFHNDARFGSTALYQTGCSETAHLKSGINYLLFWEAILGAEADGCVWYETGEAFPQAKTGKERDLTIFKGKFGGELHRLFRGEIIQDVPTVIHSVAQDKTTAQAIPSFRRILYNWLRANRDLLVPILGRRVTGLLQKAFLGLVSIVKRVERQDTMVHKNETIQGETAESIDTQAKVLFSKEGIYKTDSISCLPRAESTAYADVSLRKRLDLVRQFAHQATVIDLCCATGQHLINFSDCMKIGIGVDFSLPYVQRAKDHKNMSGICNAEFICGDVKKLPFREACCDIAYSFSSLYVIPEVSQVIHEISRVLRPGGKCVLDLGNLHSLNTIACKAYPELAQLYCIPVATMKRFLREAALTTTKHRAFQILPLWADRPKWLKPLLWPGWTRLFAKQIKGRMLDEWISNLPVLKFFAFRHVFVCEKR
jgi:ubiquinone/menaquinone biosynthesis C-methylase UbiE